MGELRIFCPFLNYNIIWIKTFQIPLTNAKKYDILHGNDDDKELRSGNFCRECAVGASA